MRIVIAEDHTILRAGLKALLSSLKDVEVVGEAGDGREAVRRVDQLQPDLVLMDLSMPKLNGMEAIKEIKNQYPEMKIIALTVHRTEEYIRATLQAGADGYVLKDASQKELLMAIDYVMKGKQYLSPGISDQIIDGYLGRHGKQQTKTPYDTLSRREREILKLIAEGNRNKEIADHLCLSVKTVEKHRSNLLKKLDLHNSAALTAFALQKGIIAQ
jgi:DNA-binding NarL/FixJ family response regulator